MSVQATMAYHLLCDRCGCPFFGSPPGKLGAGYLVQQAKRRGWSKGSASGLADPGICDLCPACTAKDAPA